jgi:hypothetical protein
MRKEAVTMTKKKNDSEERQRTGSRERFFRRGRYHLVDGSESAALGRGERTVVKQQ